MVESLENTNVIPVKLRVVKPAAIRVVGKLHVTREFGNLHEKKEEPESTDEIPFDKWIMPPQPERYIKGSTYDFL